MGGGLPPSKCLFGGFYDRTSDPWALGDPCPPPPPGDRHAAAAGFEDVAGGGVRDRASGDPHGAHGAVRRGQDHPPRRPRRTEEWCAAHAAVPRSSGGLNGGGGAARGNSNSLGSSGSAPPPVSASGLWVVLGPPISLNSDPPGECTTMTVLEAFWRPQGPWEI